MPSSSMVPIPSIDHQLRSLAMNTANMGSEYVVAVYYRGANQIAQYGLHHGFPLGKLPRRIFYDFCVRLLTKESLSLDHGRIVLSFLSNPENIEKLKAALDRPGWVYEATKEQEREQWARADIAVGNVVNEEEIVALPYPSLDTGGGILEIITNATEAVPILLEPELIHDKTHEWKYIVDLDSGEFEMHSKIREGESQTQFGEKEVAMASSAPSLTRRWKLDALPTEEELGRLDGN